MSMVSILNSENTFEVVDLSKYNISYYDYDHKNADDDFIPLMKRLIGDFDTFVFATPVYWYSMSAIMKVFFDRITDLLTIEKDLGRKLRTKKMAVLSCSDGNDLNESFIDVFEKSADYLGMDFVGHIHTWFENDESISQQMKDNLSAFNKIITSN